MDQFLEVRDMHHQGISRLEIARRTGLDRKTIRKYLRSGSGPPRPQKRSPRNSLIDPYREYLNARLAQGCRNAVVLLRELKKRGYQGGYSILKRYLHPLRQEHGWRVELRWESPPGQYAQVDWGHFKVKLPGGEVMKLYVFVFTLCYSRAMYMEWATRMDMVTLERFHEHAFTYLGGVPRYIVYDRMKTVIQGEDAQGQARFNPAYMDFAAYYGFTPKAAPAYWPRGKGKVESGVKYVRHNFWQGLVSISGLDDLNQHGGGWLDQVANTRTHGTTGRVPFEMLKEEVLTLCAGRSPYPAYPAVARLVSHDCLVSYGGCRYSVPARWAGEKVWVRRVRSDQLVVTAGSQVISEQPLEPVLKRTIIDPAHYATLLGRPRYRDTEPILVMEPPSVEVQHRPLAEYEALVEVAP